MASEVLDDAWRAHVRELTTALGVVRPFDAPAAGDPAAPEVDLQRVLTAVTDRLLERVAQLTAASRTREGALNPGELLAARVMLTDLTLIAGAWRALHAVAARRLDAAAAELAEATAIVERALTPGAA